VQVGGWIAAGVAVAQDKKLPPDEEASGPPARQKVAQSNIDRVTAELGRHAGDVGEKKRLKVLTQNRRATAGRAEHALGLTSVEHRAFNARARANIKKGMTREEAAQAATGTLRSPPK
jgi:hypothetical protein